MQLISIYIFFINNKYSTETKYTKVVFKGKCKYFFLTSLLGKELIQKNPLAASVRFNGIHCMIHFNQSFVNICKKNHFSEEKGIIFIILSKFRPLEKV